MPRRRKPPVAPEPTESEPPALPPRPKVTRKQYAQRFVDRAIAERERRGLKGPMPAKVRPVATMEEWRERCGHLIHGQK